jgi:ADP-heptose:LPS heptosyltransferase
LKILLVRLRQIGDVVFTTPAIRALRRRFPDAHLTYIVEPAAAAVVAENTALDDVRVAPRARGISGLRQDLALGRQLGREGYDVAIDFHGGPRASLLTWLSGAPVRIGYEVIGRSWMYTRRIARPRALRARHSVENQWDVIAPLGIDEPDRTRDPVEMPLNPSTVNGVARRLADAGVSPADRLAVIHVSAGNPFRRWPIGSFGEVAAALATGRADVRVVVTSGPSEAGAATQVIEDARGRLPSVDRPRILSCGEFSLAELRALVERAALYIGGDSGPLHIAATSAVPIVALYGPTLPARSAPWRDPAHRTAAIEVHGLSCRPCDQRVCVPGDFRCLTRISPAEVVDAARRLLD